MSKRDIDLMYELGALRLVKRQWARFHMPNVGDLADHHYRVVWLALLIASREDLKIDTAKMMKMAMVHDVGESRTGDVDYIARQYVERHEDQAVEDMFAGTSLQDEFVALWHEYEARDCWEAKIVKDADNLDVDFEIAEQGSTGHHLARDWQQAFKDIPGKKFYTKTAQQLHAAIPESDPHSWHITSPKNRINGGDWYKEQA